MTESLRVCAYDLPGVETSQCSRAEACQHPIQQQELLTIHGSLMTPTPIRNSLLTHATGNEDARTTARPSTPPVTSRARPTSMHLWKITTTIYPSFERPNIIWVCTWQSGNIALYIIIYILYNCETSPPIASGCHGILLGHGVPSNLAAAANDRHDPWHLGKCIICAADNFPPEVMKHYTKMKQPPSSTSENVDNQRECMRMWRIRENAWECTRMAFQLIACVLACLV